MKKIVWCILLICGLCAAWGICANAAAVESCVLHIEEGYVEVSGQLDYDGDAAILIQYKKSSMESYEIGAFYQKKTNEDRSFSYRIVIPECDATIRLSVSGSNKNELAHVEEFYFPSFSEYKNAIASFQSYEGIKSVFEDSAKADYPIMLNMDTELLSKLKNKDIIYRALAEKTAAMENIEEDFDEVIAYFDMLCEMNTIAETGDHETAKQLIAGSQTINLEDSKTYAVYTRGSYGSGYESDVFAGMKNPNGYATPAAFYAAFDESVILSAVKNLLYWADTTTVLRLAESCLSGIDFSGYTALGEHGGEVDKLIAFQSYTDVSALVTAYNAAVTSVKNQYGQVSGLVPGPGSFGGGGGGGGIPRYEELETPEAEDMENAGTDTGLNTGLGDLDQAEWAAEEIRALVDKNIISGYADNSFKPNQYITRSEFVKLLVLAIGLEVYEAEEATYRDVRKDHWSYGYVEAASREGIVMGVGDGTFAPDSLITREEISVMVYRAMSRMGYEGTYESQVDFSDWEDVSDWAADAVAALSGIGLIHGYENGEFAPKQNATRAETAVMIHRMMQKL